MLLEDMDRGVPARLDEAEGVPRSALRSTGGSPRRLAIAVLLCSWLSAGAAQEPAFLTDAEKAADFASFCRFVEQEYAYFDVKKTDWRQVCEGYGGELKRATDRDAYVQLLEGALAELYDAHAHLGTHTRQSPRLVPTHALLFAAWINGKAVVTDVRVGSAAERAGLRPGDEVLSVDGEPIEAAVARIEPKHLARQDPAARTWALQRALAGRHDRHSIRFRVQAGERVREFEFVSAETVRSSLLEHRVVGEVGYVRIHNALGQRALVEAFDRALADLPGVRALVLDLRDTPSGGNSSVARGIMGRFVSDLRPYQRHELVSEYRTTGIRRVWDEYVAPRGAPFLRPIVVLVGRWTGSMGEGLAIGLNAARGAPVLGEPMAHLLGGLGETALPHSKIVVRVPTEKLFHVDGTPREAFIPRVIPRSGASTEDRDLDAALALARQLSAAKP